MSHGLTESNELPRVATIRQTVGTPPLADPIESVVSAIQSSQIQTRLPAGSRIALTVGSRGIAGIDQIAQAVVRGLRTLDYQPFIVAAMGSHGGGTPEGQRSLLGALGVTEESVGCPIETGMETVTVGSNSQGLPIPFDRKAFEADGIVLLNRIKPHTSFTGQFESGLLKMLVVGLGKCEGAAQVHQLGLVGLRELLPEVGSYLLKHTPVVLGVALLENAEDRICRVVALEPEEILGAEPGLLEEARRLMGRLPFDQMDVLIVGELGKNYSGTGMDPNVIGRQRVETMPDLERPVVTRLGVLDLAPESHGNALGIGLADLTTERLVQQIDPVPMRLNCRTSNFLARARIPLHLPTDRDVIGTSLQTCWKRKSEQARMVLIPNTLELEYCAVTTAMVDEVEANPRLSFVSDFRPLPIDQQGRLDQAALFPQSLAGRRQHSTTLYH